jgi:hypothetical protein
MFEFIMKRGLVAGWMACVLGTSVHAQSVERWGVYEVTVKGPTNGNPFLDVRFAARFAQGYDSIEVPGFYDGDGNYRVRFSPEKQGRWSYSTIGSVPELNGKTGDFTVVAPTAGNHGPVRVANTFHFAYADGTPYKQVGTTCYVWTHQPDALQETTLKTLAASPFNKLRFCVFPKRYSWNTNEPSMYAFEGTPRNFDTTRFNPKFFQHFEKRILDLQKLGIEADIILLHPYDDVMEHKTEEDWERIGQLVSRIDPFHRLLGIHNGKRIFNQTRPWITHASIQNGAAVEDANTAGIYRDAYRKPVVYDEVKYEGDIPKRWGNISAEEMVHRFWIGTVAGTYVGHGETYLSADEILWWSKGGVLKGQSPARLAFLRKVLEDAPAEGIEPIDKWQHPEYGGKPSEYYLVYLGRQTPPKWEFRLPKPPQGKGLPPSDGMKFTAEVLDTWNMTVTPVSGTFTIVKQTDYFHADKDRRSIDLPGRPYMAIRIKRVRD